jgi:hypothetical protein
LFQNCFFLQKSILVFQGFYQIWCSVNPLSFGLPFEIITQRVPQGEHPLGDGFLSQLCDWSVRMGFHHENIFSVVHHLGLGIPINGLKRGLQTFPASFG